MAKRPPIYRKHNKCHRADTCKALVDATTNGEVRLEALVRGAYPGRSLPPGALPHLKSVGFWHADHDQDWGLDWHRNEGIEITFLESGEIGFGVNNHRYAPRPGDLMITRPWQPHTVGTPTIGASRLHWLILGKMADDESHEVRAMAAYHLFRIGEKETGLEWLKVLLESQTYALMKTLSVISWIGEEARSLAPAIKKLKPKGSHTKQRQGVVLANLAAIK